MALPEFTNYGILPEGIHECSIAEAEQALVKDGRRRDLWQKLIAFIDWVRPMGIFQYIYIDGSFLTDKSDPKDIDLVLEFTQNNSCNLSVVDPQVFNHFYVVNTFSLDVYFAPTFIPPYVNDLREFFQYIGVKEGFSRGLHPTDKKGIVKVSL